MNLEMSSPRAEASGATRALRARGSPESRGSAGAPGLGAGGRQATPHHPQHLPTKHTQPVLVSRHQCSPLQKGLEEPGASLRSLPAPAILRRQVASIGAGAEGGPRQRGRFENGYEGTHNPWLRTPNPPCQAESSISVEAPGQPSRKASSSQGTSNRVEVKAEAASPGQAC